MYKMTYCTKSFTQIVIVVEMFSNHTHFLSHSWTNNDYEQEKCLTKEDQKGNIVVIIKVFNRL